MIRSHDQTTCCNACLRLLARSSYIMADSNSDLVQALVGTLTALTPQFPVINQQSSVNMTPRSSSGHSNNHKLYNTIRIIIINNNN